jgi:cytidylate kinase
LKGGISLRLSVAIDGPAGAGKSTIAKILAKRFSLMYINTGAMYRAVTLKALEKGIEPLDIEKLMQLIDEMDMKFENDDLILNGENINEQICLPMISNNVSNYAAVAEVRERLVHLQRKMSERYNVVMDGRDIGTVVLKDAPFKFYLTASAEERAIRRYNELREKGIDVKYEGLLEDIIRRDYIDSNREVNPLTKAEDAIEIDSSHLSIEQVVDKMADYINQDLVILKQ